MKENGLERPIRWIDYEKHIIYGHIDGLDPEFLKYFKVINSE